MITQMVRVIVLTSKQTNAPTNGHCWKQYHLATISLCECMVMTC